MTTVCNRNVYGSELDMSLGSRYALYSMLLEEEEASDVDEIEQLKNEQRERQEKLLQEKMREKEGQDKKSAEDSRIILPPRSCAP